MISVVDCVEFHKLREVSARACVETSILASVVVPWTYELLRGGRWSRFHGRFFVVVVVAPKTGSYSWILYHRRKVALRQASRGWISIPLRPSLPAGIEWGGYDAVGSAEPVHLGASSMDLKRWPTRLVACPSER